MLRVDFHTHTYHSQDCITPVRTLIAAARERGLDRLVVTDHNTISGALEAIAAAPDLVIVGEEVQTTEGEFLAAFITEELPRGLEPLDALRRLKDQGAFISVSHPFDLQRSGWSLETLKKIAPLVDAIETFNARVLEARYNHQAQVFAESLGLPGTAGSDAHHHSEVGSAYSLVPAFADADSLRAAIQGAQAFGVVSSPLVHFYSSWARMAKKLRTAKTTRV